MADTDKAFAGSIPELYDRFLVPLIFGGYASDMAARVAGLAPQNVLEIAAGTGVVTRALAPLLQPSARLVATDLNQPMLDRAMAQQPADARITWQQADALSLPFPDQSFEAVLCQFGVMFFPDKPKAYREAHRVLKPGGRYVFNVWDRIAENGFAQIVHDTVAAMFPQDPPGFLARTPYGHFDTDRIRRDLAEVGFRDVTVDTVSRTSKAPSARDVAVAYCEGTPLRAEVEARDAAGLAKVTARVTEAVAARFGRGEVEAPIRAIAVTAVR
jgi:ubiquinone/menaquinone biosynthesis C-methylase UbiE